MTNPSFFDSDSERAVLGAALLDNACIETLRPILLSDDFYTQSHRVLWDICLELSHDKKPVDIVTVNDAVRKSGIEVDAAYIAGLTNVTPSSANVEHYANIIKKQSMKRQLYLANREAAQKLKDSTIEPADIAGELSGKAATIATAQAGRQYCKASEHLDSVVNLIAKYKRSPGELRGISLGFKSLDYIIQGLDESDYVIIGARASQGKTAIALNMIEEICINKKVPTGFFSLEMSEKLLGMRMLSSLANVQMGRMKSGYISQEQVEAICGAGLDIARAPLFIADTPNEKIVNIRSQARRMVYTDKVKIIFIDHFSLIGTEGADSRKPRWQQMSELSKELKRLTRELHVPIILLAQLGRTAEGKEPALSDLRETGSLEEDGDLIMFLNRERTTDTNIEAIPSKLVIAKNRNGATGVINMTYYPKVLRFKDEEIPK
jgi:replicative DNA helicase